MAENNTQLQVARKQIVQLLESQKAQITMALPQHMDASRLIRVIQTEMSKNPKLYECSQVTVLASAIMAASLGWEPGVNGQCYLVPYFDSKRKEYICQMIPGWQGYADLVSRAGRASIWTGAVREGDDFDYHLGSSPKLEHKPGDEDVGEFTHVYAVGWINGAQWPVIEVWSRAKVRSHLNQYNKVGDWHYANANENNFEMYARKVALLQVIKYMPKSVELRTAQSLDYRAADGEQNLRINSQAREKRDVIIDADFVDIGSHETHAAIDNAPTRTEQVKAAVSGARKDSAKKAEAAVQEQQAQARTEPEPQQEREPDPEQAGTTPSLW